MNIETSEKEIRKDSVEPESAMLAAFVVKSGKRKFLSERAQKKKRFLFFAVEEKREVC